jgi:hypothetical protein
MVGSKWAESLFQVKYYFERFIDMLSLFKKRSAEGNNRFIKKMLYTDCLNKGYGFLAN